MKQLTASQIIVGPVRLSYLHVFKPRLNNMKTPPEMQFSATILIPKEPNEFNSNPKAELKGIADTIKTVREEKFAKVPNGFKNPLKDGDTELNNDGEPKYPGYYYLTCTAKEEYPPKLVDTALKDVTGGWNSGDWGYVKMNFFAFDQPASKGVSCGLKAIQFCAKDESLGGGESTADGFDAIAPASGSAADEFDPFAE